MFIYGLIDPRTGCLRYVGKTENLRVRLVNQIAESKVKRHHRANWILGIVQAGLKPSIEVLEEVHSSAADAAEQFWIASLRAAGANLVNRADGGEGGSTNKGRKWSAETRAKMRVARLGRKHDEATKRLIAAASSRQRHSDATKAKLKKIGLERWSRAR